MELDLAPLALSEVYEDAERAFRHVAEQKGLSFKVEIDPSLPASIVSDEQRLGQVLKNLLSNAFKFTHDGGVTLSIGYPVDRTGSPQRRAARAPSSVIAFSVIDTGVGIPDDKLNLIFEAFQQADGTTSRKYGGTGLGLSISREIARLLGGEIQVDSTVGQGSRFSLFLPLLEERRGLPCRGPQRRRRRPVTALLATALRSSPIGDPLADEIDAVEHGDRVVLVIDSKPESGQVDGRGGPRPRRQGDRRPPRQRIARAWPASTGRARCCWRSRSRGSSRCSGSSRSIPTPAIFRSRWSATRRSGSTACAPARRRSSTIRSSRKASTPRWPGSSAWPRDRTRRIALIADKDGLDDADRRAAGRRPEHRGRADRPRGRAGGAAPTGRSNSGSSRSAGRARRRRAGPRGGHR